MQSSLWYQTYDDAVLQFNRVVHYLTLYVEISEIQWSNGYQLLIQFECLKYERLHCLTYNQVPIMYIKVMW